MFPAFFIAVQGFAAAERQALDAGFRLSALREPHYQPTRSLERSDFVIANAERAAAIAAVVEAGRVHDAVFIGERAPAGAAAQLPRPIDPLQVLRELDALALLRHGGWPRENPGPATRKRDPAREGGGRRRGDQARTWAGPAGQAPLTVLLIEPCAGALSALEDQLRQRHAVAWRCTDAAEHHERLLAGGFDLVIIAADATVADPDALTVCRQLRHQLAQSPDASRTRLVMALPQATDLDRARAALATCDACLQWPAPALPAQSSRDPAPASSLDRLLQHLRLDARSPA